MQEMELWELERAFWIDGEPAYAQGLAPESLMVFAPPVGVLDRVRTLEAIRNAPRWKHVVFAAERAISAGPHAAALVYEATAERDDGSAPYRAQCSSAYVRIGGQWRLALHQQTPLAG